MSTRTSACSYFNPRSPYGERPPSATPTRAACYFNPRSPYGERRLVSLPSFALMLFQSTLPLRGATETFEAIAPVITISIHAPLTGSDGWPGRSACRRGNFNPRSPYGERPAQSSRPSPEAVFQSTLPLRGATRLPEWLGLSKEISIHAPLTGSDRLLGRFVVFEQISIHAPLTGSDPRAVGDRPGHRDFNPRSPYGERR